MISRLLRIVCLLGAMAAPLTVAAQQVTPPIVKPQDPVPRVPMPEPDVRPQRPYPEPRPVVPATPRDEVPPEGPRVPADFEARGLLAIDPEFVNRVTTATLVVTDDVLTETAARAAPVDPRLSLVGNVMRDPEQAGRRMARLVAANVPATMLVGGSRPQTPLTDDELTAFIAARWTALASAAQPAF